MQHLWIKLELVNDDWLMIDDTNLCTCSNKPLQHLRLWHSVVFYFTWSTVAYLHILVSWGNVFINLQLCFWPPCVCMCVCVNAISAVLTLWCLRGIFGSLAAKCSSMFTVQSLTVSVCRVLDVLLKTAASAGNDAAREVEANQTSEVAGQTSETQNSYRFVW